MKTIQLNDDQIFNVARKIPPGDGRNSYLDQACGIDTEDRVRIDALLAAYRKDDCFLEKQAIELNVTSPALDAFEKADSQREDRRQKIGPYKLLEVIGEGGMGTVYMAEQTEPVQRRVAIKLIKAGMDTCQVIARFEAERQALALMDHPNIAKVLDAGATESGRPYFVMELVKGMPITQFCDEQKLDLESRLRLFQQVCHAVQHAHQKGIIHRDLKPSNVLVAMYDDRLVPKVIDFGVSKAVSDKLTDKTMFTRFGQIIGTLEYMSPEQAQFNNLDIDTRSDIYSLGAILYELMAGEPPFDRKKIKFQALDETLRMIREDEPTKPSTRISTVNHAADAASNRQSSPDKLGSRLRGDLDWIVMKALEKNRARRYDAANGLAMDVERYLNFEAVEASPPTRSYRFQKFVQRNQSSLTWLLVVVVGLFTATVASTLLYLDARQARNKAVEESNLKAVAERTARLEAETARVVNEFVNVDLLGAADPELQPNRNIRVRDVLDRASLNLEARFANQPLVEAALRRTIGKGYRSLGIAPKAAEHLERALDIYQREQGRQALNSLWTALDLNLVIHDQRHYQQVRSNLEVIVQTCQKQFGSSALITLHARWQLAEVYNHLTEYDKAIEICEQDLPICLELLKDEHESTFRFATLLAVVHRNKGEPQRAETIFSNLLPRIESVLGKEHILYVNALTSIGKSIAIEHRHAEAERWFRRGYSIQLRVLGPNHPDTFETRINIAASQFLQGERDSAISTIREIIVEQQKTLGMLDPATLGTQHRLALLISEYNDPHEAIKLFKDLVPQIRLALDPEDPTRRASIKWYGKMLRRTDQDDAFINLLREELEFQNESLGPAHMSTRRTVSGLREFFEQKDNAEAINSLLDRQIQLLQGENDWVMPSERASLLAQYRDQVGLVLAKHNRIDEAVLYWEKAAECREFVDTLQPENLDNQIRWGGCLSNIAKAMLEGSGQESSTNKLTRCLSLLELAEEKLSKALTAAPNNKMATDYMNITQHSLAKANVELSRFERAAENFGMLARSTTGSERIRQLRNQVNAFIRAFDFESAFAILENQLTKESLTVDDRFFMARAYSRCLAGSLASPLSMSTELPYRVRALSVLNKLVAEQEVLPVQYIHQLRNSSDFQSIRDDDEFGALVERILISSGSNTNSRIDTNK